MKNLGLKDFKSLLIQKRGVTLVALVVTIVVLLILAGITISLLFNQNSMIEQANKAKEETRGAYVEEQCNLWKLGNTGLKEEEKITLTTILTNLKNTNYLTQQEVEQVIQTGKVTIGNKTIDFLSSEDFNTNQITASVRQISLESKTKIEVTAQEIINGINKIELVEPYQLLEYQASKEKIVAEFEINKNGKYEVRITNAIGKEKLLSIEVSGIVETEYVTDGLLLHYDGINNTGNGHDNTATVWKDLSGNGRDGALTDFNYTEASGWSENALQFDGAGDGVNIGNQLEDLFRTENTVEILLKADESGVRGIPFGNYSVSHNINYEIYDNNSFRIYFNNGSPDLSSERNTVPSKQIFLMNMSYLKNSNEIKYYQNNELLKTFTSTNFGSYNYSYTNVWLGRDSRTSGTCLKGKIYAVRIYNRVLTEQEKQKNYETDKVRFGF